MPNQFSGAKPTRKKPDLRKVGVTKNSKKRRKKANLAILLKDLKKELKTSLPLKNVHTTSRIFHIKKNFGIFFNFTLKKKIKSPFQLRSNTRH